MEMAKAKDFIGKDMTAVTPYLYVEESAKALAYYEKLFGAKTRFKMDGPGGKILHAEVVVNGALFMMGEANPDMKMKSPKMVGGSPAGIFVYVPDVDATFKQALASGSSEVMALEDMFWGDRTACIVDPFGHNWTIATHKEDLSDAEVQKRSDEWMAKNAG
jgi:PhnB protein